MAHLRLKLRTLSYFSALFIFFLFFFISVLPDDAYDTLYENETAYMLSLREALTPTPPNWASSTNIWSWNGVACVDNLVDVIDLTSISLTGKLPSGLNDSLSTLTRLDLHSNNLSGPIPSLANLDQLQYVDLGANSFASIPEGCFQGLTALQTLKFRGGFKLKPWKFPIDLNQSLVLRHLDLTATNLVGSLPDIFDSFQNLETLYLSNNSLSGVLPESLATLPQLKVLDVSNNNLSGNIPKFSRKVNFTATGNDFLHQGTPNDSQARGTTPWIAGASAIGVGVIVIVGVVIYNHKRCLSLAQNMMFKQSRTSIDQSVEDFIKSYGFLGPKRYSYLEVKKMTNSFRDKLGQGGYGTVFKATLTDGHQVAVKVLSESKGNGEEFINEVASISRTSHMNIVSLLGFCYEINKRALIYEFMPNGSLDKFIYEKRSPDAICNLDWDTLYKITIGIARGLEYLHQGCGTRILHLDIKPQNVLLDEDFCPKIADFGLAKICRKKESIVSDIGPRGTIGYIAPELFSRTYGGVSYRSDVYSYGMLILDIVGGRKNYYSGRSQTTEMYFPDWIYKDLEQGNILTRCLVSTNEESDMVMKIILVSLWCTQQNPSDRPSMSKVIEMLEGPLQAVPHPPKPISCSPDRPPLQFSNISYGSTHDTNSISA